MGTWFSLFNNWETFARQALALVIVLGSYFGAEYVEVRRPRRRGEGAVQVAREAPHQAVGALG